MVASLGENNLAVQQPLLCINRVVKRASGGDVIATSAGVHNRKNLQVCCSMRQFIETFLPAYRGETLPQTVPFVQVAVGEARSNPDREIFVRSQDGRRWLNRNPDPERYAQGNDGNFHLKEVLGKEQLRQSAMLEKKESNKSELSPEKVAPEKLEEVTPEKLEKVTPEKLEKVVPEKIDPSEVDEEREKRKGPLFVTNNADDICDVASRANEVADALVKPISKLSKTLKALKAVGSTAGQVAAGARIVDGYKSLQKGFVEEGSGIRTKLTGITEILFGLAVVAFPPLSPVALSLSQFLLGWDLKDAAKEKDMRGEMTAVGWMGAMSGWLIPYVAQKSLGHLAGTIGGAGCGLLALKDLSDFALAYRKKDPGGQFTAVGNGMAHIGMALMFLLPATAWIGMVLIALGLAPLLVHKLSSKFAKKIEEAVAWFNRNMLDPIAPGAAKGARPLTVSLNWLRDKVVKPTERFLSKWLIDKPLKGIGKPLKPLFSWFERKIEPAVNYVIVKFVFGAIDKPFIFVQKRLAKLAKAGVEAGKVVKEKVAEKVAEKVEGPAY